MKKAFAMSLVIALVLFVTVSFAQTGGTTKAQQGGMMGMINQMSDMTRDRMMKASELMRNMSRWPDRITGEEQD